MQGETAIVVGSGVVGLACAHRLLRSGVATTLIAPADTSVASWGNAGHLAVEQVEPLASRKAIGRAMRECGRREGAVRLPFRELPSWLPFFLRLVRASGVARFGAGTAALRACMERAAPAWRRLLEEAGDPALLIESGHFVVWESHRSAERGKASWRGIDTGPASFRDVTDGEREQLEALVTQRISGAIRFEGTGQFADPAALRERLEGSIASAGGERVTGRVVRIETGRGRTVLATDDGGEHSADAVVIAAGVASGPLLAPTGVAAPVIAERGYHIQAAPSERWPAGIPPVVFEDRSLIVTRFTSGLRASSFVEFARAERPPDAKRWRALKRHAAELGLPFGEPVSSWMGPRPTLPDYLPAIGRHPRFPDLYYAFGHQHLGLTLAAVTAELIGDLVAGRTPAMDVGPFRLERFGRYR